MQNILNKLAKNNKAQPKRALSKSNKVAVKLSIMEDIDNELERFENASGEASYLAYEYGDELIEVIDDYRMKIGQLDDYIVNGNTRDLEEVAGNLLTNLSILQDKANELGIDPNELYADYDELYNRVENSVDIMNDAEKKYKEVVEYSGVLNNFWN